MTVHVGTPLICEALGGLLLHLVLDPRARRVDDRVLVETPLRLRLGELRPAATRLHVAGVDDRLQPGERRLHRPACDQQPSARFSNARRTSSPPSLIADSMAHRLVVGRRLLAPAEQVLVLLRRRRPELERLGPRRRRRPAVLLEQASRVPHPVHREGVVDRRELAARRCPGASTPPYSVSRIVTPSRLGASMTSVRSSSWSRIVLIPIAWAPELSMRSGGLPPTKRGCSSVAICVEGETSTVDPSWVCSKMSAANST